MKHPTPILLALVLTACGDDGPGMIDSESSTAASTSTADPTAASEGVDEGSTTEPAEPPDPRPILEREPLLTHACEETRAMTSLAPSIDGRIEGLVVAAGEAFAVRSAAQLTLDAVEPDGTLGSTVVLEAEAFSFRDPLAIAIDDQLVLSWTSDASELRYAVIDATLGIVVAPRAIPGIYDRDYVTAVAMVPAPAGGVALLYAESDEAGPTILRFVTLDAAGEPIGAPVDVHEIGEAYARVPTGAALTSDGGYAVAYVVGDFQGPNEVFFVILEADGTQRFAPQRISREAVDGWSSRFGSASRRSLLTVGDESWVAFTEELTGEQGSVRSSVITLAVVDAQGQAEQHRVQAPEDGRNNLWPSFVELGDRVGLLWTSGSIPGICVGCVSDNDLYLVLLDPAEVVPASNVAIQPHSMNGITAPLGAVMGAEVLTAAALDFHALTLPATGALRCEPIR